MDLTDFIAGFLTGWGSTGLVLGFCLLLIRGGSDREDDSQCGVRMMSYYGGAQRCQWFRGHPAAWGHKYVAPAALSSGEQ